MGRGAQDRQIRHSSRRPRPNRTNGTSPLPNKHDRIPPSNATPRKTTNPRPSLQPVAARPRTHRLIVGAERAAVQGVYGEGEEDTLEVVVDMGF